MITVKTKKTSSATGYYRTACILLNPLFTLPTKTNETNSQVLLYVISMASFLHTLSLVLSLIPLTKFFPRRIFI